MLLPWWAIGKQRQLLLYNSTFRFVADVQRDLSLSVSCHSRLPCPSAHLCCLSFLFFFRQPVWLSPPPPTIIEPNLFWMSFSADHPLSLICLPVSLHRVSFAGPFFCNSHKQKARWKGFAAVIKNHWPLMEIIHGHNPSNSASIACGRPGGCVLTAMETDMKSVEGCNSLHCATRSGFFFCFLVFLQRNMEEAQKQTSFLWVIIQMDWNMKQVGGRTNGRAWVKEHKNTAEAWPEQENH